MTSAVYLYGDLCIYAVAVPKSLAKIVCDGEEMGCMGGMSSTAAYHVFLTVFVLLIAPLTLFDVTKSTMMQLSTTLMRWLSFLVMILIAGVGIATGRSFGKETDVASGHVPVQGVPASELSKLPELFGVCIYS